MLEEAQYGRKWACHDICSQFGTINYMHGVPDRRGQNLSVKVVVVIDLPDFSYQLQAIS